ncbi:hypothetical protein [Aestuariimicrobium ganziense]|uniref:hypothetical protein n=1 Tax=Aestuariimicrobium ganziense TaxID=2773677 RepID=UPI001943CEF3|nr:hypothetical protein [Aestuariimicrobium ganziense]
MIIWRGWGILTALIALAGIGGGAVIGGAIGGTSTTGILMLVGGLAAAAANWFLGVHLNQTTPQQRIDAHAAERAQFLQASVARGDFTLGPGQPRPQSMEEAQAQAAWLLDQEKAQLAALKNQHSLFFIPMQWFSVVLAIVAVVIGISVLTN